MASIAVLVAMAVLAAAVAAPVATRNILVGHQDGWKLDFDYKEWVAGKSFYVGDSLEFVYTPAAYNVIPVNESQYENCDSPAFTVQNRGNGRDVISLKETGKKWYICGVSDHCSKGMKLAIQVIDLNEASIAATPPRPSDYADSAAIAISPSKLFSLMIGAALALFLIILAK